MSRLHGITLGVLMELCYIGLYIVHDPLQDIVAFIVVNGLTFLLLVVAVIASPAYEATRHGPEKLGPVDCRVWHSFSTHPCCP